MFLVLKEIVINKFGHFFREGECQLRDDGRQVLWNRWRDGDEQRLWLWKQIGKLAFLDLKQMKPLGLF